MRGFGFGPGFRQSTRAGGVVPGTVNVVTEGDSITNGLGSSGVGFRYPDVGLGYLPPDRTYTLDDIATSGITVTNSTEGLNAKYPTRGGAAYDPTKELNVFTLMAGTNDGAGSNALAIYRGLRSILRKAKATGYQRRAIGTLISRNSGVAPDGSFDAGSLPLNIAISSYWDSDLDCDGLFDFADSSLFDEAIDADDTTYYVDKLHPTDSGYAVMGPIWGEAVANIILAAGERVDAPPIFSPFDTSAFLTALNSGRTIAWAATGFGDASARAFPGKSSGKWYWEMQADLAHTVQVGLVSEGFEPYQVANSRSLHNDPNAIGWGWNGNAGLNGRIVYNGTAIAAPGALVNGDIIEHAVDLDAHRLWMRKAGGSWNANASANPATGVGGINIAGLGEGKLYPSGYIRQNGGQITSGFLALWMIGTPPSGFLPLGA